ncbi:MULTISPECIES: glycine--tRNA ligase subunit beta [Sphingomonas]|uniref:Glycine--tRNA ligase beta subunit n=1 Tax=Sphingomonas molluscorum TaxID=418184 RepID=A0ABU8Q301_9SPHN|nr:glycine--tRNA ligase subunit beta [Sphingomonas sp. JUb134]MBM7405625.1 glycyl-tRNA synthetase beta chain [Sphingomonas sp. JUb134]
MSDFLLELRSEEIPARMQERAREDLAKLFAAELGKAGLKAAEIVTYASPRRLALIARGLPLATEAVREEVKGPRASAPPQALEGFLRKTGLTREDLVERDGVLFAVTDKPGRATAEVLAEAVPAVVRAFPWPTAMRWGAPSVSTESPRWVRPLQGIVALLDDTVVPFEVFGVTSGAATLGHRFHHPGAITIGSAHDYVEKLRACHVIVDGAERRASIAVGAKLAAQGAGLTLVEDEGLLFENAGLTEFPMPLLGRFDASYLSVPPEVIQLTARVNQKYFVCRDAEGKLADAFVCTANIDAEDGGDKIVEGNRKVLAARLSDAKFFYETDLKTRLEDLTPKLEKIVFHEKLGTVADKVDRVAKLARWLVEQGIVGAREAPAHVELPLDPSSSPIDARDIAAGTVSADRARLADMAERAARLAKADLVTGMVGEFPELQGLMGGYYAAAQGEPAEVAEAIRDHYKPVGQGDDVPTAPVAVAVALADKLDSITQFFGVDLKPSGSKDPFALRRSALGVIALLLDNKLRLPLSQVAGEDVLDFFADRLKVQQREAGVRHDLIDAVFALGGEDDLVRLLARVHALQGFVTTEDGTNLLAGYKRAANILKKEGYTTPDHPRTPAEAGAQARTLPDHAARESLDPGLRRGTEEEGTAEAPAAALGQRRSVAANAPDATDASVPTGSTGTPGNLRHQDEEANQAVDRQGTTEHDGTAHPFAGGQPDGIPQTGEEDPLVEVEQGEFTGSVAAFARSERAQSLSYEPEPAEDALMAALDVAEPRAAKAIADEDFEGAMAALASLRAPIDAFFDKVTVNDADPAKRTARLALLARVRAAVHRVADFSRIEG